ncbi:MAG: hypothetical protein KBT11_08485 [Treponema sp.]|nr:hypothetical protein [Candidatus Treponema equifaecale]
MKKNLVLIFMLSVFFSSSVFSVVSDAEKKFIRGSIAEKIEAVTEANEKNAFVMGSKGIDYVLSNIDTLGPDSELSSLALASFLAISKKANPERLDENKTFEIASKVIQLFKIFNDETVKINALDCLASLKNPKWNGAVDTLNEYLEVHIHDVYPSSLLIGNIIASLGNFGDAKSLSLVYNIWINNVWPEYTPVTENSLIKLSEKNLDEAIKIIFFANNSNISKFLDVVKKSSGISQEFKSNIAETALSVSINNAESVQEFSSVFVSIQMDTLRILSSSKWAHATEVVAKNFDVAKKEYSLGIISDEEFIQMLDYTAAFGTSKVSLMYSNLLADFNGKAEKSEIPSEPVVLAVISKLGDLGDKVAFDNLLYVTYLNYSDAVKDAAKVSLSKLKW